MKEEDSSASMSLILALPEILEVSRYSDGCVAKVGITMCRD